MSEQGAPIDVYGPKPEGLALAFHHAAIEAGRLQVQRCDGCGQYRHPPRYRCPACFSPQWSFVPAGDVGTVYSYVVSHRSFDRAWAARVPHVTVAVELAEGPRVIAALRGVEGDEVSLGLPVRLTIEAKGDDFAFVWADPAS